MIKNIFKILFITIILSGCGSSAPLLMTSGDIYLKMLNEGQSHRYVDLDYGIRIGVKDRNVEQRDNILTRYDANPNSAPKLRPVPNVVDFTGESLRSYMRNLGFDVDFDISSDYFLEVNIDKFELSYVASTGWVGMVRNSVSVYDKNRKIVFNQESVGRSQVPGTPSDRTMATKAMNLAFMKGIEDVDWDKIAYFVDIAKNPALEKNKQVTGQGNTALESTVIRWNVESSPAGARVFWRVVSSTPEVKNTNENYLSSTPYESTETFDIKGLTFNNSGNIQIEIKCSKTGYMTQKKRFNLRQVLDQKEISSFFDMVKDE
ncbi:MAG: hypothetical protein RIC15_00230 [Vicingaceae bacterium]